ncbi:hypothetical protein B0H11DRAFT_1920680 [Mycena galericulata]|nr:hypothetical protein B0H11DRAFT_1920680 [Mycena galericulata]
MSRWMEIRFHGALHELGRQGHPGRRGRRACVRKVAARWGTAAGGRGAKKYGTRELQSPRPFDDLLDGADEAGKEDDERVFGGVGEGAAASEAETADSHVYGLHGCVDLPSIATPCKDLARAPICGCGRGVWRVVLAGGGPEFQRR